MSFEFLSWQKDMVTDYDLGYEQEQEELENEEEYDEDKAYEEYILGKLED